MGGRISSSGSRISSWKKTCRAGDPACGASYRRGISVSGAGIRDPQQKVPLPELFEAVSRRTDSLWKDFFAALSEELRQGGDLTFAEVFAQKMERHLSGTLTGEEQRMFVQAGRNLLSDDLVFHREASEKLSEDIRRHVAEKEKELDSRKKVLMALCLSGAALLVILLF